MPKRGGISDMCRIHTARSAIIQSAAKGADVFVRMVLLTAFRDQLDGLLHPAGQHPQPAEPDEGRNGAGRLPAAGDPQQTLWVKVRGPA